VTNNFAKVIQENKDVSDKLLCDTCEKDPCGIQKDTRLFMNECNHYKEMQGVKKLEMAVVGTNGMRDKEKQW